MNKGLEYYLKLPYTIEVVPIPKSQGGGYMARLPEVGRFAIVGDGETIEEAIANLEDIKRELFSDYLEKDLQIPEPKEEREDYSGKFVIRIPKALHRQLSEDAKGNEISLNQHVTYLLTLNSERDLNQRQFKKIMGGVDTIQDLMWDLIFPYSYDTDELSRETKGKKQMGRLYNFPLARAA